jgi:hypothetical protein
MNDLATVIDLPEPRCVCGNINRGEIELFAMADDANGEAFAVVGWQCSDANRGQHLARVVERVEVRDPSERGIAMPRGSGADAWEQEKLDQAARNANGRLRNFDGQVLDTPARIADYIKALVAAEIWRATHV